MLDAQKSSVKNVSPQVSAALIEVTNTTTKIMLSSQEGQRRLIDDEEGDLTSPIAQAMSRKPRQNLFEEFTTHIETYLSKIHDTGGYNSDLYAALGNAIVRRAIFATAMEDDGIALQNILVVAGALNPDITLVALDCLKEAWKHNKSRGAIMGVPKAYLALLKANKFPEIQSTTMYALAEALDQQFNFVIEGRSRENCLQVDRSFEFDTEALRSILEDQESSPSLSNARIRVSGCILLSECVSQRGIDLRMQRYRPHLETWGQTLCLAGDCNNVNPSILPFAVILIDAGFRNPIRCRKSYEFSIR